MMQIRTRLGKGIGVLGLMLAGCAQPNAEDGGAMTANVSECQAQLADTAKLEEALDYIDANETFIDSLIIQQCGNVLIERYYGSYDADKIHDMQSATKTFSAALIGIGLKEGWVKGIDQPIAELLPDYDHLLEGEKANITLRHLLTMTSGLAWEDFGEDSSFLRIAEEADSIAFILSEPLVSSPGETFFYNTGSSHLLSAIVSENTGISAAEYAEQNLFQPLEISEYEWAALSDGVNQGGWGLFLRPQDSVKFGQLLLDEGVWGGVEILPSAYVEEMTRRLVDTYYGSGYGFQMWIENDLDIDDVAGARGWGGQDIFVLDDHDVVVSINGSIMHPEEMSELNTRIMKDYVAPAISAK